MTLPSDNILLLSKWWFSHANLTGRRCWMLPQVPERHFPISRRGEVRVEHAHLRPGVLVPGDELAVAVARLVRAGRRLVAEHEVHHHVELAVAYGFLDILGDRADRERDGAVVSREVLLAR